MSETKQNEDDLKQDKSSILATSPVLAALAQHFKKWYPEVKEGNCGEEF